MTSGGKIHEQRRLNFEGLAKQGRNYLAELGLRETLLTCTNKFQYKRIIIEKLKEKNRSDILQMCKKYKKIDFFQMKEEEFGLNKNCLTMTLAESRILYNINNNMIRGAKTNFLSDPVYSKQSWRCECGEISTTLHFRYCLKYAHLHYGKDFSDTKQLVKLFQDINKLRDEEEKNSKI